ncbi:large conductance mechanosensitive channel protein MscL [Paenibacillus mendelii]|uniref:Large-conductance mechanosensitive channel n=1 Tax=Paenibacillus mendelii TaxID=206163 RepID=A0ABV6JCZ5_9BACL|nr:large conductance mechanosensitive channel protein MscL [Paenibacillus mendelii]MCQ6562481.1 large conductance mechanosensitive channel protein MscL [Paenibacillus mendelii]
MMKVLKEFKEFAVKGNVLDLAVGVIIGAAFGKIVTSMVNDMIMPPISKILGNVNFVDMFLTLDTGKIDEPSKTLAEAKANGAVVIAYGQFINVIIDFTIVAFCIFLMVKGANTLRRMNAKEEEPAAVEPTEKDCPYCLSKIPLKATRCSHCTSHISEPHSAAEGSLVS